MYPKITIVTPSFNQGQFLEATILSVIGQMYPNLEYIIIDGGSSDESVSIIKKYENYLSYWVSEPDHGQSHAINKGFARATGEILAWLNSDDLYMPGVLFKMADLYRNAGDGIYFGNAIHFQHKQNRLDAAGSNVDLMSKMHKLSNVDYIIQPSTFWSRKVWDLCGEVREDMHFAFDWEWFIRAERKEVKFIVIEECVSLYRIHSDHKSKVGGMKRREEILSLFMVNDERAAQLYQKLMHERLKPKNRVISKTLRIMHVLGWELKFGHFLKLLKFYKYRGYSFTELNNLYLML